MAKKMPTQPVKAPTQLSMSETLALEEVLDEAEASDPKIITIKYPPKQTVEDDVNFRRGPGEGDNDEDEDEEEDDEENDEEDEEENDEDEEEPDEEEGVDEPDEEMEEAAAESPFGVYSKETADSRGLKTLLYGPAGSGKTWLAATFPEPLFLDLEGGLRTVFQLRPVLRFPKDPSEEIQSLEQVREFYRLVRSDPDPHYDTLVIDSLNELQVLVTKEVLGQFAATRQYEDQMTMADYGKVNRVFLQIVRAFLKLPYHVVMTAVETPREYEGQEVYPKFTGKQIWPELQRMVDQIGYLHVRKGENNEQEHVVSFMLHTSYVAKDRLGIRERFLPNNFKAILAAVPADVVERV